MNRRDFLTLTTRGDERVLDLSCERLYMRYVDARSGLGRRGTSQLREIDAIRQSWVGEPPTEIDTPTTSELFGALEEELAATDILRVRDCDWLSGDFAEQVEARVEAFARRGGRVELLDSASTSMSAEGGRA